MWIRHKDFAGNLRLTNLEAIASIRLVTIGSVAGILAFQGHDQNAASIPLINNVTPEIAQQFLQRLTLALASNECFLDLVA